MNDLRHDPDDRIASFYREDAAVWDSISRTVPMPPLRSADAHQRDAQARDLPPRTGPERIDTELAALRDAIERIADAVTVLMLERDITRERGRG